MLEDSLFASRPLARSKNPATLVLSVLFHAAIAGALILIPLFQDQVLPQVPLFSLLQPPSLRARSVELVPVSRPPSGAPSLSTALREPETLIAPEKTPSEIVRFVDEPQSSSVGFLPNRGTGIGGDDGPFFNDLLGIGNGPQASPPLPPPRPPTPPPASPRPPEPEPAQTGPVRIADTVVLSNLVYSVKPVYPVLAIKTHTEGRVMLEAVITREGTIDPLRLRVVEGHVLLTPAAVEAVRQWRYRPTLLRGQPVEVLATITVNFTLN